jgi:hypothetical protein
MVDDLALFPFAQDPAGVLARHIGQGSQVILANLVSDEQLALRRGGLSKVFGKLKQGACDACLERKKARGRYLVIGLPQTLDKSGDEVTVNLRIVTQTFEEITAGHEGQFAISERLNRGGPWQSVKHCEFADDRSRSEDSEDPLCALRRSYAHLEDALFEPIAAIADRANFEECLPLLKRYRRRPCQQSRRVLTRQSGQEVVGPEIASPSDHRLTCLQACETPGFAHPQVESKGTIPSLPRHPEEGIRITDQPSGSVHSVFAVEITARSLDPPCQVEARTRHGKCYDEAADIPSTSSFLAALRLKLRFRADVDIG